MQDQLVSFPLETVTPILVRCLQESTSDPNMAVYAARIVAWLADIAPQASCSALVQHGVVGALCSRLLDIEFIDVAEACIEGLKQVCTTGARLRATSATQPAARRCVR
jgi:hypothetical protein